MNPLILFFFVVLLFLSVIFVEPSQPKIRHLTTMTFTKAYMS